MGSYKYFYFILFNTGLAQSTAQVGGLYMQLCKQQVSASETELDID